MQVVVCLIQAHPLLPLHDSKHLQLLSQAARALEDTRALRSATRAPPPLQGLLRLVGTLLWIKGGSRFFQIGSCQLLELVELWVLLELVELVGSSVTSSQI